ncbi:hypothetical protein EVAR_94406_1 [Eumeta japonica]|uniref:Uncharacterized protein n=1 Tax=Eumeta variegata TaxID=151549 RepID=A0A4C1TQ37_EUMVA|nr:hypothetical protein EVAR_94406_1 [Eumeta japonica]
MENPFRAQHAAGVSRLSSEAVLRPESKLHMLCSPTLAFNQLSFGKKLTARARAGKREKQIDMPRSGPRKRQNPFASKCHSHPKKNSTLNNAFKVHIPKTREASSTPGSCIALHSEEDVSRARSHVCILYPGTTYKSLSWETGAMRELIVSRLLRRYNTIVRVSVHAHPRNVSQLSRRGGDIRSDQVSERYNHTAFFIALKGAETKFNFAVAYKEAKYADPRRLCVSGGFQTQAPATYVRAVFGVCHITQRILLSLCV